MVTGGFASPRLTVQQIKTIDAVADLLTAQVKSTLSRFSNLAVHVHSSEVKNLKLMDIPPQRPACRRLAPCKAEQRSCKIEIRLTFNLGVGGKG